MDLYAYTQIERLSKIAELNGINIPRLRGYRLMGEEEAMSQEKINELKRDCEIYNTKTLCASVPFWNPNTSIGILCKRTDYLKNYYLIRGDGDHQAYIGVRWDRIHGWKRRILKFEIKKDKRRIQRQFDIFNKYVGREDVLYIHARIGGNNWAYFGGPDKVTNQPWFLEKVDDCSDSTYCDIYAKIDPVTLSMLESEE